MKPLNKLKKFLDKEVGNNAKVNDDIIAEMLSNIEDTIRSVFKGREPTISPSSTNMSTKDMWLILNGRANEVEKDFSPELKLKMIAGGVLEHVIVALMEHAGVKFADKQKKVELIIKEANNFKMKGTLDYIIEDKKHLKVWDMKTTNMFSFKNKFSSPDKLAENDKFGYLGQAKAYELGAGVPFGGWHVVETNFFNFNEVKADNIQYEIDNAWETFVYKLNKAINAKTMEELDD